MSNTRHLPNGRVPPALTRDGAGREPPAEAAQQNLIGLLVEAFGQVLGQQPWHPACLHCVNAHKQAAAALAEDGGGNVDQGRLPEIAQAITWAPTQARGAMVTVPVCYGHYQPGPGQRATGLVAPSGQPIVARR